MSEIGKKLFDARTRKGLSRKEVADRAGVTVSAVAMYEAGERVPRDAIKMKLADCYGESVENLFFALECHE